MPDLYREHGIYWYTYGFNLRAFAAFFIGIIPSMPGLVATCGGYSIGEGWLRVYDLAYFIGMFLGIVLYLTFCRIWPPEGLGIMEELDEGRVIEGEVGEHSSPSLSGEDVDKSTKVMEKQVPV